MRSSSCHLTTWRSKAFARLIHPGSVAICHRKNFDQAEDTRHVLSHEIPSLSLSHGMLSDGDTILLILFPDAVFQGKLDIPSDEEEEGFLSTQGSIRT